MRIGRTLKMMDITLRRLFPCMLTTNMVGNWTRSSLQQNWDGGIPITCLAVRRSYITKKMRLPISKDLFRRCRNNNTAWNETWPHLQQNMGKSRLVFCVDAKDSFLARRMGTQQGTNHSPTCSFTEYRNANICNCNLCNLQTRNIKRRKRFITCFWSLEVETVACLKRFT